MSMRALVRCLPLLGFALPLICDTALPTRAHASPAVVNCVGSHVLEFDPGLTNQLQTVTLSGQDSGSTCVSVTNPELHSFIGPFSGETELSCTSLLTTGSGTETLYWNGTTHLVSVWNWTISFQNINGTNVGIAVGPIVSGVLAGATLTQTITVPETDLGACSTEEGMTENGFISTWAFVRLL